MTILINSVPRWCMNWNYLNIYSHDPITQFRAVSETVIQFDNSRVWKKIENCKKKNLKMKYFLCFVGLVISFVLLEAAPADLSDSDSSCDSDELPTILPQTVCPEVHALPFKAMSNPKPLSFRLYMGRIKAAPFTLLDDPNAPGNLCSPLSFAGVCQGTQVTVDILPDGTKIVRTASYNSDTKNVICYEQSLIHEDPNYHVFKGTVNKMRVISEDGVITEIPTIPQSVLDLQSKQIVTLWYGKNYAYAIYATCDLSSVWVSYSEQIINGNLLDSLKEEIDQKLIDFGFNPSEFIDVPVQIPIGIDQCLYPNAVSATSALVQEAAVLTS